MKKLITLAALTASALSFNASANTDNTEGWGLCSLASVKSGYMSITQAKELLKYIAVSSENPQKTLIALRGGHGFAQGYAAALKEIKHVTEKEAYQIIYAEAGCEQMFARVNM